jgi:Spy/CpxP family protein refolding chaperone
VALRQRVVTNFVEEKHKREAQMKKATLMILLLVGVATTLMLAQSGPKPPDPAMMAQHRVEFLTNMLDLSQAQQTQASTIFTTAARSQAATMQNMHAAHQALQTAIKNNDGAAIDQAAATIGNLTAQMTAAHAKADAAFLQTLNSNQQNKFLQLQQRGPGMMMHRRGPMSPPEGGM